MATNETQSTEVGAVMDQCWVTRESELAVFAKVTIPEKLLEADVILYQEQPEAKLKSGNKTRVRMEMQLDKNLNRMKTLREYIFSFKLPVPGTEDGPMSIKEENNVRVNKEFYENWLKVADYCQKKIRFVFKAKSTTIKVTSGETTQNIEVPDVCYEVDVFLKPDGETSDVCKIDIEVDSILKYLDENHPDIENAVFGIDFTWLPFEPKELIYPREATPEQRTYLDGVYKDLINQPIEVQKPAE